MRWLVLVAFLCFAACSQQGWIDRLASRQEQALVLKTVDQVRAGQIDQLARGAEPALRQQLPSYVKQVAPLLTHVHGDFQLQTVSSFTLVGGPTTKTFIVQGGSDDHWAIVRVVLQESSGEMRLVGLNVTPFDADPSKMDRFEFGRRGSLGYVLLAMMVACASTCVWATVLIWRRRWLKRRWLWTLGSLFGFAGFGLNWSTGSWAILFVNISLFGAQATKAGPYAPWLLSFGLPVIALIVIVRWYRRPDENDHTTDVSLS